VAPARGTGTSDQLKIDHQPTRKSASAQQVAQHLGEPSEPADMRVTECHPHLMIASA
jgi:hypothetical protein